MHSRRSILKFKLKFIAPEAAMWPKGYLNEARAGRYLADAMETTPGSLMLLRENGILKPYASPELAKYPEEAKTKADASRVYWVTDREAYLGFGYNTRMISSTQVPKNFQDLLRPELKGKLAVTTESSSARVIGSMLKYKGDGFMKKLKDQEVKLFKLASLGFLNLLVAGEIAGSPTVFRNQVVVMKEKGAPIDWVPLDVVRGKCRWLGHHCQRAPSSRRFAAYRLCHWRRRPKAYGTVQIWRSLERISI